MENRTLVIRIPLKDSDPENIIGKIDSLGVSLQALIDDRFEDIFLTVETGDRVSS